jgi:hypothetical protein
MPKRKPLLFTLLLTSVLVASGSDSVPSFGINKWVTTPVTARGVDGQRLTVAEGNLIEPNTYVTVSGKGYRPNHGIYVTYCVVPPKGKRPELCGPFDITGQNNGSVWVSSNPPTYAALLVTPFGKSGSFKVQIQVTPMIGDKNCRLLKCAITTRADHTQPDYRKADVFVPVKISKP